MKEILFSFSLAVYSLSSIAQTNIFPSNGSVGIGTSNPLAALDVRDGSIIVKNLVNTMGESKPMITQSLSFGHYTTFGTAINTYTEDPGWNSYALQFFTHQTFEYGLTEKMRIAANGNVGIGTATPNEKLAVNGNIRAKEIKVEATNWPDYVFKKDYELMPLKEVEQHILQHGHLPDIPKAEQIEKEGVSVSEMNKLMMKKIEELTLHLIEKDKRIVELELLNKRFEDFEQRLRVVETQRN